MDGGRCSRSGRSRRLSNGGSQWSGSVPVSPRMMFVAPIVCRLVPLLLLVFLTCRAAAEASCVLTASHPPFLHPFFSDSAAISGSNSLSPRGSHSPRRRSPLLGQPCPSMASSRRSSCLSRSLVLLPHPPPGAHPSHRSHRCCGRTVPLCTARLGRRPLDRREHPRRLPPSEQRLPRL
jgi:hypothetical protein